MPKISASKPISRFLTPLETSKRNTKPPNRKPWRKKCQSKRKKRQIWLAKSKRKTEKVSKEHNDKVPTTNANNLDDIELSGSKKRNIDYARNIEIEGEPNHDVEQSERVM